MGFFDDVGSFFTHTIPNAVEDTGRWIGGAATTVYNGGKEAVNTVWYGAVSGVNRGANIIEGGAKAGIDVVGGVGKILSNPLLVIGGIVLAAIIVKQF